MRQKTIRVFEVDNYENLKNVVESKYELIKNHWFLLKEHNEETESFLKSKNLSFFTLDGKAFTSQKEITPQIQVVEKEIVKEIKTETIIYDKIIRSGEEIKSENNLVFLNRINAGAKIYSGGDVSLFCECDGFVRCDGETLIVKKNKKGTIIFKGEDIGEVEKLTIFYKNGKKVLE
jgi:septum site-determining protein MinC